MSEIKVLEPAGGIKVLEPAKPPSIKILETAPGVAAVKAVDVQPLDPNKYFGLVEREMQKNMRREARLGDPRRFMPKMPFWDKVSTKFNLGWDHVQTDFAGMQMLESGKDVNDPEVKKILQQRADIAKQLDDPRLKSERGDWLESSFLSAVQIAPPMMGGFSHSARRALEFGAGGAAAGAYGGGTAGTIVVPGFGTGVGAAGGAAVGGSAGAAVGGMYGGVEYWSRQGAGNMYLDSLQAGVDKKTAAYTAAAAGLLYGSIELSQMGKLIPGLKKAVGQKTGDFVKRQLGNYGEQVTQEALQEIIQVTQLEGAKYIDGMEADLATKENFQRVWEATTEAMKAMPWLMLPGASVDAAQVAQTEAMLADFNKLRDGALQREFEKARVSADKMTELIGSDPNFEGLVNYNGRVILAKDSDGKWIYRKLPEQTDDAAAIIAFENDNPDAVYSGMFELGAKEVPVREMTYPKKLKVQVYENGEVVDREFETPEDALFYAQQLGKTGNTTGQNQIVDAVSAMGKEAPQIDQEVVELGTGTADPVKLGKHRLKAPDIERELGGKVSDLVENDVDTGYEVAMPGGHKLRIRFGNPTAAPELRDSFVASVVAESGGQTVEGNYVPQTTEEFGKLDGQTQQSILDAHQAIGFYKGLEVNEEGMPPTYAMYLAGDADLGTFRHEAIHFLRDSGVLTGKEYETLVQTFGVEGANDKTNEERIAVAYEAWMAAKEGNPIFAKIRNLFAPIANLLKRRDGFDAVRAMRLQDYQGVTGATEGSFAAAFHGSGAKFDRFDSSKIGTGEGHQAFGHGMYFADSQAVAQHYKDTIGGGAKVKVRLGGQEYGTNYPKDRPYFSEGLHKPERFVEAHRDYIKRLLASEIAREARYVSGRIGKTPDEDTLKFTATDKLRKIEREINDRIASNRAFLKTDKRSKKWLREAELEKESVDGIDLDSLDLEITEGGYGYKVELAPKDDEYLLWDKPIEEQPKLMEAIAKIPSRIAKRTGESKSMLDLMNQEKGQGPWWQRSYYSKGEHIYKAIAQALGSEPEASAALLKLGIRGIKFLDGSSRRKGEGNFNYVIFDDADVQVTGSFSTRAGDYYSRVEKLVADSTQNKATGKQWAGWLEGQAKKTSGLTDELKWRGLEQIDPDRKYTKEELLGQLVTTNPFNLDEMEVLGEQTISRDLPKQIAGLDAEIEKQILTDNSRDDVRPRITLPDGRELPPLPSPETEALTAKRRRLQRQLEGKDQYSAYYGDMVLGKEEQDSYKEHLFMYDIPEEVYRSPREPVYYPGKFTRHHHREHEAVGRQKSVFMHVRHDTRQVHPDSGMRAMVVHEVQSDWAEGGSKYGVASEAKEAEFRAEQQQLREVEEQFSDTFPELRDAIADYMNNADYYYGDLNTWYLDAGYNHMLAPEMDKPNPSPMIQFSDWAKHKSLLDFAIFDQDGNAVEPKEENFLTSRGMVNDPLLREYRNAYDAFKERGQGYHKEQVRRFNKAARTFKELLGTSEFKEAHTDMRGMQAYYEEEVRKVEPPVPDMPWMKEWWKLGLRRMIQKAAETGHDFIAFPSTAEQVAEIEAWSTHSRPQAIIKRYVKDFPKYLDKWGKQFGVKVQKLEIRKKYDRDGYLLNALPITPEMKQAVELFSVKKRYADKGGISLPEPGPNVVILPQGTVERELAKLFTRVEEPTAKQLARIPGSPRKDPAKRNKEHKNVTVTSYADLKEWLQWGIDNNAEGDWYRRFGEFFIDTVGQPNLQEASIIFGITSAQNSAENNLAETLSIMALAREINPLVEPDRFAKALRVHQRPDGQKLGISNDQINAIVNTYATGTYVGGLKISTYMQTVYDRGLNLFNPFTVQDVHMARVFGWRQREWKEASRGKPAGWKDATKIPGDPEYRYSQWLTAKLALDFGITPNEAQAYLWFYAKSNLSPKKAKEGSGTLASATEYSAPEIKVLQDMVAAGRFDKDMPVNEHFEERMSPTNKAKGYNTRVFHGPTVDLITMVSPQVIASFKPGNASGYGFPLGTTFAELLDYHERVLGRIVGPDGQIEFLKFLGVPHTVQTITGTFEGKEPSVEVRLTGQTLAKADQLAPMLGHAFMQDAAITSITDFNAQDFGLQVTKPDGSEFTQTELDQLYLATNPNQDPNGLNFSTSGDNRSVGFADPVYYQKFDKYTEQDLDAFVRNMLGFTSAFGYQTAAFGNNGTYHGRTDYKESLRRLWGDLSSGHAGGFDLSGRATDLLYQPVWDTYNSFRDEKGFGPSKNKQAPAELLGSFSVRRSGSAQSILNHIDALGKERAPDADMVPSYGGNLTDWQKRHLARPSQKLVYFVGPGMAQAKQRVELREAYMAKATMDQAKEFNRRLVDSAYDSQRGWKLPKWLMRGKWANRLKDFQQRVIHMAAHLNATGRDGNGQFEFGDFEMRAGLMSEKDMRAGGHMVGDKIMVVNKVTKREDELVIGKFISTPDGRAGYQLVRPMNGATQKEVYDALAQEYPDLIWALDMYIDPALKGSREMRNGVEIPVMNRFSMESMMAEADPTFEAVKGYTPDVIATRSLAGAIQSLFNPKEGARSPGRKYKTGRSREEGDVKDLFTAHTIRTFQVLREKARKEYFDAIMTHAAKPIPKSGMPEGYVKLSTGLDTLLGTIRAFRFFKNKPDMTPVKADQVEDKIAEGAHIITKGGRYFQVTEGPFAETEARLSEYGDAGDYGKFLTEAYRMRGETYMIRQEAVDALSNQYVRDGVHGKLYNMGGWLVRNATGLLLAMPSTMIINIATNDLFTAEVAFSHTMRSLGNLATGNVTAAKSDLRFVKDLTVGNFIHRSAAIRKMLGIRTGYDEAVDKILPDEIFAGSTSLTDLDIQYDRTAMDYLSEGEISSAALQGLQYGNIDVRAKQRMAYAWLKANAVRDAEEKGLSGRELEEHVNMYMAQPPEADLIKAVEAANFEYLNYSDSPHLLQRFASNQYSKLVIPFPRFGYHYMAKQIQKAMALKKVFSKIPMEKRAEAFGDFMTFLVFGAGLGGIVLDKAIREALDLGDEDEDVRERMGTSEAKYVDPETGEVVTKQLDRTQITANRVNLSYYARGAGIGSTEDDNDFWVRVRNFPFVAMGGNAVMAYEDAKKFGFKEGVKTFMKQNADLYTDFFQVGAAIKVPSKAWSSLMSPTGGRAEEVWFDPYSTNVPFSFYITDQAMTSLVPGKRQFTEVMLMIDPTPRKKTASKDLGYEPGAWEAVESHHASGILQRVLVESGLAEEMMAQGTVKTVSLRRTGPRPSPDKARAIGEGMAMVGKGEQEARMFRDPKTGTLKLAMIPHDTRPYSSRNLVALRNLGLNLKPVDRDSYEEGLKPTKPTPRRRR